MITKIAFFTGTGNSLAIARKIAEKLDAQLISIPTLMHHESLDLEADTIGFVFPVYHKGLPLIIKRFVEKLDNLDGKYIFAAATYGDNPCMAIKHLNDLIEARDGQLAAGFGVHMPYNYISPPLKISGFFSSFRLREVPIKKQQALLAASHEKVMDIVAYVTSRKSGYHNITKEPLTRLADALNLNESLGKRSWFKIAGIEESTDLSFIESRQLMDQAFSADENCNGCGTCARVCPVANIQMVEDPKTQHAKPTWLHHCEQCVACLHWCPQHAIQFRGNTTGQPRYHHPKVKLADMIQAASQNSNKS